jgi:signal transduction histidine kinase
MPGYGTPTIRLLTRTSPRANARPSLPGRCAEQNTASRSPQLQWEWLPRSQPSGTHLHCHTGAATAERMMLHEFLTLYRDAIIARTRERLVARPWPSATPAELEDGVPLFLTQLSETLRREATAFPFASGAIATAAARHGGELVALGFSLSQVVHDYGDICQVVTELALEHHAPITTEEFHTLNRCLDTAIAEAVTEHGRVTAERASTDELERSGQVAHEIRNMLNIANLAFAILKGGTVAVNGSTGAVLGRSLTDLTAFVNSALTDIRLNAQLQRREQMSVEVFVNDLAVNARLQAEYRGVEFGLEPGAPTLAVTADPQLLASAVTNLLNNAFRYTRPGSRVVLRVRTADTRLLIEVEDECGGLPDGCGDLFQPFGQRRGRDRTGLGLGLSIARKAVRAHGGDIATRNIPGHGCVFIIDLPLASEGMPNLTAVVQ